MNTAPTYLWFDTEFTSLDMDSAALLQVSLVVTDTELQRITSPEEDLNLYVKVDPDTILSSFVEEHLEHVLNRCRGSEAVDQETLSQRVESWLIDRFGPAPESEAMCGRPVIAGNSVYMDVMIARRRLPVLLRWIHYRVLDVSTVKILWQDSWQSKPFDKDDVARISQWFPDVALPVEETPHDAYFDVQASIAELAYYRHHLERVELIP